MVKIKIDMGFKKGVYGGKQKSLGPDQSGFSIIEVMIGIAIFSIGILAVGGMQMSGIRGNTSARQYTEASTAGMDRIETLMTLPYNHPDLTDTDGDGGGAGDRGLFDVTVASADHFENDPNGQYTIYWNVAQDDLIENSKTVSVIIIWSGNMQRSVSLQRVIPEII